MKGLVFLHCGLPLSWPELGPRAWEGGVGRTQGLPPLLAPEAGMGPPPHVHRVWTSPLCKHNSGRNEEVISRLGSRGGRADGPEGSLPAATPALPGALHVCP